MGKTSLTSEKTVVQVRPFVGAANRFVPEVAQAANTTSCGVCNSLALPAIFAFSFVTRSLKKDLRSVSRH